jgi:hypothetical protein
MSKFNKTLLFINIVIVIVIVIMAIAYAWTNPSANPPGGGGALYYSNGNVGIGTTNPEAKLEVVGDIKQTGTHTIRLYDDGYGALNESGGVLRVRSTALEIWDNKYLDVRNASNAQNVYLSGSGNSYLNALSGNVGIGTTAPGTKLDVAGYIKGRSGLCIGDDCRTTWPSGGGSGGDSYWALSGSNIYNTNSGNVGIGTTNPGYKLDVIGDIRWSGTLQGGSVPWTRLTSFPSGCTSGQFVTAVGNTLTCATPSSSGVSGSGSANYIAKWTGATTLGNSTIYDNGTNVGIGTTAPGTKLDVAGYIKGQSGLCINNDCKTSWLHFSNSYSAQAGPGNCASGCTVTTSMGPHSFCALISQEWKMYDNTQDGNHDSWRCDITTSYGSWSLTAYYNAAGNTQTMGYTVCKAACIDY